MIDYDVIFEKPEVKISIDICNQYHACIQFTYRLSMRPIPCWIFCQFFGNFRQLNHFMTGIILSWYSQPTRSIYSDYFWNYVCLFFSSFYVFVQVRYWVYWKRIWTLKCPSWWLCVPATECRGFEKKLQSCVFSRKLVLKLKLAKNMLFFFGKTGFVQKSK